MNDASPNGDRGLGHCAIRPYGDSGPSSEGARTCPVDLDIKRCPAYRRSYRLDEVAAMHGRCVKTVGNWIAKGKLRARQAGKRMKQILRKDLEDFERRLPRV